MITTSPTNATGVLEDTMTREYIVVMRKKLHYAVAERLSIYNASSHTMKPKAKSVNHGRKMVKNVLKKKKTLYKFIKRAKQK
ncbi:MAG: hypothetical protein ABSC53_02080 [Bacteroidota bacterium]